MTLEQFFKENTAVALGFSGGVDSSYLLYAAKLYGAKVKAYFVKTVFQPEFELKDAKRLAGELGADFAVIKTDVLRDPVIAANPPDRCYYCKSALFSLLKARSVADGYGVLIDGANSDDDAGDRPGMRATAELRVRSPLRECGMTKAGIRRLSQEAGLFTWDKPAYACLATRVPSGTALTAELLRRVELAEDGLFGLGFSDFRVRVFNGAAKIQLQPGQMPAAVEKRAEIIEAVKPCFPTVLLDMEGR